MRKSNRIETPTVRGVIIVTSPSDRRKTGGPVHVHGRISVAHFEMDSRYSLFSRPLEKIVEQPLTDSASLMIGQNRDQQKFGLVSYSTKE
jgi:hypothetical protein